LKHVTQINSEVKSVSVIAGWDCKSYMNKSKFCGFKFNCQTGFFCCT
jgi:hypothetical protein